MPYIIPYTFKAGEKAVAEQVNTNFNYIKQSLEQLNTTLSGQISNSEDILNTKIESIETQVNDTADLIADRDAIIKLGTIVTPDPTEDGQIPTADITLTADRIHTAAILANSQIILPTLDENENYVNILFEFTIAVNCTISLPLNIKWISEELPNIIADGITINRMYFDTTTNGTNWCGYFSYHAINEESEIDEQQNL